MNTKRYLLSVLAGFVGLFAAFVLLEDVIFLSYLEKNVYQPIGVPGPVESLLFIVVPLSMALIMAYLYPKEYEGGSPAIEGLRFGVLLGLFSGIPFGVFFALAFAIGFGPVLVLILIYTLEVAAGGLIIGLVYGRIQPAESLTQGA
jgi:hypothetical protein